VKPVPAEHCGGGSWQIVSGSGALADLRGKGTWTSARKLRRPKGAYRLRFGLSFSEAAGNVVSYELKVIDPRNRLEVSKFGETSTGTVSLSLRVRPTKRTRVLRIEVEATDPVGNAAQLARTLRIK